MLTIEEEAIVFVMDILDAIGAQWMLTGSLASNMYGVARATQDADFVIELDDAAMKSFRQRIDDRFHFDDQMKFETITMTVRYDLVLKETGFKIELFFLSDEPFAKERFTRRVQRDYCGRVAWVPSREDVVVQKLRWSQRGKRTKDLDDVRNVIAVSGDRIDWSYVERRCREHDTFELLEQVRREAEELMDD